jgi:site-specific DNA-methyltransferase (adenine-specific)
LRKLINNDCFLELEKIKDSSVDLIIIDPPYLISKESNFKSHSESSERKLKVKYNFSIDFGDWDKTELDWDFLFSQYARILRKGGTLIIFYDAWKSNQLKELATKFKLKQPRIGMWVKNNPVPINSKVNYLSNATEFFFCFVKSGKPTFNSQYDNAIYNYPICHGKERLDHPTQKPLNLIVDLIKKHSNEGDIVLDNFAGSGTTGEACEITNRGWILIEKEETYYKLIEKRLEKYLIYNQHETHKTISKSHS